jgi:hypothetical protein
MFICHHLLSRFQLNEVQISASGHGNTFRRVNKQTLTHNKCRLPSCFNPPRIPLKKGGRNRRFLFPPDALQAPGRSNPNRQTAEWYYVCLTCLLIRRRVMPCPYCIQARAMKLGFSFPLSLLPWGNYLKKPGWCVRDFWQKYDAQREG